MNGAFTMLLINAIVPPIVPYLDLGSSAQWETKVRGQLVFYHHASKMISCTGQMLVNYGILWFQILRPHVATLELSHFVNPLLVPPLVHPP